MQTEGYGERFVQTIGKLQTALRTLEFASGYLTLPRLLVFTLMIAAAAALSTGSEAGCRLQHFLVSPSLDSQPIWVSCSCCILFHSRRTEA